MAQSKQQRQLLMTCEVRNAEGERSYRYIEHATYPLWAYLMRHHHGLSVSRPKRCMWVPRGEFRRSDRLMRRAGNQEHVARVVFRSERAGRPTEETVRFVPHTEFDAVVNRIVPHLKARADDAYVWDVASGSAVVAS